MKTLFIRFTTIFFVTLALTHANETIFIKEYVYNASDDDSKNSARTKTIALLKSLLSEEIGTFIKSSFKMKTAVNNDTYTKLANKELTTLSSSFTKLTILDEKWNGREFYIKAKVIVDKEKTLQMLKKLQEKSEQTSATKSSKKVPTIYVTMTGDQPIFRAGEQIFTAEEGEVYQVLKEIPCLKGGGQCWILKNTNDGRRGVARVSVIESFHEITQK